VVIFRHFARYGHDGNRLCGQLDMAYFGKCSSAPLRNAAHDTLPDGMGKEALRAILARAEITDKAAGHSFEVRLQMEGKKFHWCEFANLPSTTSYTAACELLDNYVYERYGTLARVTDLRPRRHRGLH
jgi:hypothetical protein